MAIAWGIVLVVVGGLAWVGQTISWLAPARAQQWGLMERESDVDPAFFADVRGEARWDALTLWALPVAGVLLAADSSSWAYFGLVGAGSYGYFAGRGVSTRMVLRGDGVRIGEPESVRVAIGFLLVWGATALITLIAAVEALRG